MTTIPTNPSIRASATFALRFRPRRAALVAVFVALCAPVRADDLADAQRLYRSGDAEGAMQRVDRALAIDAKDPQMRFMKAVIYADTRRAMEAVALLQKLNDDYPELAEPYNNLASLYAASGDYGRARIALEQALRVNPGYATAQENLGDVYAALAAQAYARAQRLDATNTAVAPKLALVRELYRRGSASAAALAASAPTVK